MRNQYDINRYVQRGSRDFMGFPGVNPVQNYNEYETSKKKNIHE